MKKRQGVMLWKEVGLAEGWSRRSYCAGVHELLKRLRDGMGARVLSKYAGTKEEALEINVYKSIPTQII